MGSGWNPGSETGVLPRVGQTGTSPGSGSPRNQQWPHLPSCSPLLLGHRLIIREAECQIVGWKGRPLSGMGMVWGCPALPGPHQTANHKASLRQADNSALSIQAQPGWHSLHLCFSLAPVSESLRVTDSGINERGAGLSP